MYLIFLMLALALRVVLPPWKSLNLVKMTQFDGPYIISGINVSSMHQFQEITSISVCVTAYGLEKFFSSDRISSLSVQSYNFNTQITTIFPFLPKHTDNTLCISQDMAIKKCQTTKVTSWSLKVTGIGAIRISC